MTPRNVLHASTRYTAAEWAYHQWGPAGRFAYADYDRLNVAHFSGELPVLPIVIGLTAYGHCLGLTRHGDGEQWPRITLASTYFAAGHHAVSDVLVHEMLHADLILRGLDPAHNGKPWCEAITRLSPSVLGLEVKAAPVNPRRINGAVARVPLDGYLPRAVLARWPGSMRPPSWDAGDPLSVSTY